MRHAGDVAVGFVGVGLNVVQAVAYCGSRQAVASLAGFDETALTFYSTKMLEEM